MKRTIQDYSDIIDLPHYVSRKHRHMSLHDRAAQFSPFAALTGHADAVKEIARQTTDQLTLAEDALEDIADKLNYIQNNIKIRPYVSITYFTPDKRKDGGVYSTVCGAVVRIDEFSRALYLDTAQTIPLEYISGIEII